MRHTLLSLLVLASLATTAPCRADEATDIAQLQSRWAQVKYQTPAKAQEAAFAALAADAQTLHAAHPDAIAYPVWEGIIRATYAGAKGGLGALGEAKKAKALFEDAIAHDPTAASPYTGAAYTSLGSLYYQVPGWPVGFGDDDKAKELLQQGLQLDPDGIDANFFYGDYLLEEEDYKGALVAFEKALAAPPRPGRELADSGRRAEIEKKIVQTRDEM